MALWHGQNIIARTSIGGYSHGMISNFTDFGFKQVSSLAKSTLVKNLFNTVASRYDVMNDLMSFGLHRVWKKKLVEQIPQKPGMNVLDLAGGTGDVAFLLLQSYAHLRPAVTVCDPSIAMIKKGQEKSYNRNLFKGISWMEGCAECIPLETSSMDVCVMSFGLRNVTDKEKALQEVYRILKPGGCFFCLEFSKVKPEFREIYKLYSFSIIPQLGKWVAKDKEAYTYLVESIAQFPDQDTVAQMFQDVGFDRVYYKNLSQGIVAIHEGWKL